MVLELKVALGSPSGSVLGACGAGIKDWQNRCGGVPRKPGDDGEGNGGPWEWLGKPLLSGGERRGVRPGDAWMDGGDESSSEMDAG